MNGKAIKDFIYPQDVYSVYRNPAQPFAHLTGFVQTTEDEMLIYHMTPQGLYDGYILIKTEDIFKIDRNGKYENKIKKLYEIAAQTHQVFHLEEDDALFFILAEFAQKNAYIVNVELMEDSVTGFIENYNDDAIWLTMIDEYGYKDGECILQIDEIMAVFVDTQDEQTLNVLHEANEI